MFKILLADYNVAQSYTVYQYLEMHTIQMSRTRSEDSEYVKTLKVRDRKRALQLEQNQKKLVDEAHQLSPQIVSKMALYQNHWLRIQDKAQHTLSFVVFRVWRRLNQTARHRMKMYPKLQIFESLHPGRSKVFKSWRRTAHYISMRKMKTELSDSHRTIAQLNVRNQNLQVEMVSLEKRSNDHIAQLTMELYHKFSVMARAHTPSFSANATLSRKQALFFQNRLHVHIMTLSGTWTRTRRSGSKS